MRDVAYFRAVRTAAMRPASCAPVCSTIMNIPAIGLMHCGSVDNAVNGIPSCADYFLLTENLRNTWGFNVGSPFIPYHVLSYHVLFACRAT